MPVSDAETRSLTVRAALGVMDVYSSTRERMVMLVVRREPNDIYETRNVEMTPADARELADRLVAAAESVEGSDPMALPDSTILAERLPRREWMIRKSGHFYRAGFSGYTIDPVQAGLYTEAEARREANVESTISAHHASEFADAIRRTREDVGRFRFVK